MTAIRAAAESHTGYVRSNNEDLAVVSPDLAAIADGMGGHLGGEVAARTAIEELVGSFQQDRTAAGLVAAVEQANAVIWQRSTHERALHGMGTTLTAAALIAPAGPSGESRLALVNVGDSRAYKIDRREGEPRLSRLTEDHSVVEEMVRQGELSPAEAAVHPHRHVLTRALGIDPGVEVDLWDLAAEPGLRLLLCSDGLSDDVPEHEIEAVLKSAEDPKEAAHELVRVALAHGGMDNVTVVVVDVVEELAPGEEQPLALVPPRGQAADSGADRLRDDVTQALPVAPPSAPDDDATQAVDMAAVLGGAAAGAAPAGPADPPTDELATTAGREAAAGAGGEPAQLYDLEADENAGAASPDGRVAPHRSARSMTVRARPPEPPESGESTGPHPRATVLVPARRITKQYRDRVLTVRVVLFVLVLAALLGGVIGVVVWFQRSSYFVGLEGDRVSIFQGRPGGMAWFKPQLLETSNLTTKNLLPNSLAEVKKGIAESSYSAARRQLADLTKLSDEIGLGPNPSTTTTSTTVRSHRSSLPASPGLPFVSGAGAGHGPSQEVAVQVASEETGR